MKLISIVPKMILIAILTFSVANAENTVSAAILDPVFDSIQVSPNSYELTVNDRVGIGVTAKSTSDPMLTYFITRNCEFSSSDSNVSYVQEGFFGEIIVTHI